MTKQLLLYILFCTFCLFSLVESQTMWTKYPGNPVFSGGAAGTWNHHVWRPDVLYNNDSLRFEMWYDASDGPPGWEPYRIGFATSIDGIHWTTLDTAVLKPDPGRWDDAAVLWSSVLRENNQYKMWYTGSSYGNPDYKIGYATSPNGITWTKEPAPVITPGPNLWDLGGCGAPTVLPTATGYKMWYTGVDAAGSPSQIGYATSDDGISWQKHANNPVLTVGSPGEWDDLNIVSSDVIKIDSIYYLWYNGVQSGVGNNSRIGVAKSLDGITWTKYDDPTTTNLPFTNSDPVLIPSPEQWDGTYVAYGSVMLIGDTLHMWYTGSRSPTPTYLWRIGYATAPVTLHTPTFFSTIQGAIDISNDGNIVLVEDGSYQENINFKGKAITVASRFFVDGDTNHINNTIIDGSQPSNPDSGSVVTFGSGEDTTSILMGFTITGGSGTITQYTYGGGTYPARAGGGIFCYNSGGYILNNKIINNGISNYIEAFGGGLCGFPLGSTAHIIIDSNQIMNNNITGTNFTLGGGIQLTCNARIIDNIISHNSCNSIGLQATGGGVDCFSELPNRPMVYITNNRITYNSANGNQYPSGPGALGGGINSFNANLIISENDICHNELSASGNEAASGAGILLYGTQNISKVDRNNISHNHVVSGTGYGGGMNLWAAYLLITNNIVSGNSASYGGALHIATNSSLSIINNTIVENEALVQGGGIDYNVGAASTVMMNSILWANQAPQGPQIYSGGASLNVAYSDVQGSWPGLNNINADPQFADTVIYELSDSSLCIGAGIDSAQIGGIWYYAPPFDFDGDPRPNPIDIYVDIGAQESPYEPPTTGFITDEPSILMNLALHQNYPNPFNPTTNIEFDLPMTSEVTLKVFNILGEEVATLASDRLSSGSYSYEWDASNLASGVYLYRLQAGDYIETRKMVLMK